jgi:hypothetical protein
MLSDSCNVKLSRENDTWHKVNYFPDKAFSIKIFMETGFNIVEVPGSKSRKVAEKKQPWYRTAILKMFIFFYNISGSRYFSDSFFFNYSFLKKLYYSDLYNQLDLNWNLIILTVSKIASVFNSELQKTVRNIFSGFTFILVKSNFTFVGFTESRYFSAMYVMAGKESDTLKKQIKWLSI